MRQQSTPPGTGDCTSALFCLAQNKELSQEQPVDAHGTFQQPTLKFGLRRLMLCGDRCHQNCTHAALESWCFLRAQVRVRNLRMKGVELK